MLEQRTWEVGQTVFVSDSKTAVYMKALLESGQQKSVTIQCIGHDFSCHGYRITWTGYIYSPYALEFVYVVYSLEIRSTMSQQHQTISDFGLTRKLSTNRLETAVYNFLTPFIGGPFDEAQCKVYDIYTRDEKKFLLKYAVSVEKATFLVINAELENEDTGTRNTNMRLHEMILDSWIAESGSSTDLRHLCIWRITNEGAFEHMIDTYMSQYHSICKENQVNLNPEEGTAFHDNIFLRCGLSLVRELQCLRDGNLVVRKAYYIKSGTDEDDLIFHIIIEFGKVGDEEESVNIKPESEFQRSSDSSDGGDEVIFRGRAASRRA